MPRLQGGFGENLSGGRIEADMASTAAVAGMISPVSSRHVPGAGVPAGTFATAAVPGNTADLLSGDSVAHELSAQLAPLAAMMTASRHDVATQPLAFAVGMAAVVGMYWHVSRSIDQSRRKIAADRFMMPLCA